MRFFSEPHGGEQGPVQNNHHLPLVPAFLRHPLPQQDGHPQGEDRVLAPCHLLPRVHRLVSLFWRHRQGWADQLSIFNPPPSPGRTPAGSWGSSRIHPENVPRTKPRQGEDAVRPLHLRHRHGKHPLRVCGCQRHHPQTQSEGVQPGVRSRRRSVLQHNHKVE